MTDNANIFRVRIVGTRPLLMSNVAGVAPSGPEGERLKELNSKRKLTNADMDERRHLKFAFALYCDDDIGPFLPAHNIWAAGKAAAKIHRLGEHWKRGVMVLEDRCPLVYEGPRTVDELFADRRFVDIRVAVLNGKSSIEAVRPTFPAWSLEATFAVDDNFINVGDAKRALTIAGPAIGVGTYRERFGRFTTEFLDSRLKKAA